MKMRKLFSASTVLAVAFVIAACSPTSEGVVTVGGRDLDSLVAASDLVVIGSVVREAGTRNLVRDPYDVLNEHSTLVGVAQDYEIRIEKVAKGTVGDSRVVVTNSRSMGRRGGEQVQHKRFLPLTVGGRYVLFAKRLAHAPTVYALAFEPSVFELGRTATVRSTWAEASVDFPPRPAEVFVTDVMDAAAKTRGR